MNLFGKRVVSKHYINKAIREDSKSNYYRFKKHHIYDYDYLFFSKKERSFLKVRFLTIYENKNGEQYCRITSYLPSPSQEVFRDCDDLIGKYTGYNTKIISCEPVYVIG